MRSGDYLFDGVKSIPLQSLGGESFWWADDEPSNELSVGQAYRLVPYLYRAVDIRAKTLSAIPWSLCRRGESDDLRNDAAYHGLTQRMRHLLYLTEASLCVYGQAYWLRETNQAGRNERLRWLLPSSVQPRFDVRNGIVGFDRIVGGKTQPLGTNEVVYFWLPSLTAELGSGVPPAQVALKAAQVLYHLDQFTEAFFRRGAIKATLLTVEGNPPKQELERLESWWRRMLSGVRSSWQSVAIRSTVKPVIIGDGLGDMQNRELTVQQREHVCAAMGVPHSLLSADAANYATAQSDKLTFLHQTVIPVAQLIEEVMNEQLFVGKGLQFRFHPEQLEEMQQHEVAKAKSLVALVECGIVTVDEARSMLGYKPGAARD